MNTFHKVGIAVATLAVMVLTVACLFAERRVDMTLQKSVQYTSSAGNQVEAGIRVHLDRDPGGYRLTKEGWVTKLVDGRRLEGNVGLAVDSRRAR